MRRIGVYLGMEPYGGGAFQYCQSILLALKALPSNEYQVIAFYEKELWLKYLLDFPFMKKKVYTRKMLFDWKGALLLKTAIWSGFNIANFKKKYADISMFSRQFDDEHLDLIIFPAQEIYSALLKTKSIAVIHDLMHRYENFPEASSMSNFKWREYLYKNICESASMIFVDSEVGKYHVLECYGDKYKEKLEVMPFTPPPYLFEYKDDAFINDNSMPKKFIFYPAQFWRHKNHKNLIYATKKLKEDGLDIQLIFVGSEKNGYKEVMNLIRENRLENNISVLGYVSDVTMKTLYKNARAMIMPSYFGPTNIPPLEGMAMGCPVAVSRRYAMPWQVEGAGLTFDPDDIDELANVIEKLWTDDYLCKELSAKGKERSKYFSQDKFNERFKKAINQVANNEMKLDCD